MGRVEKFFVFPIVWQFTKIDFDFVFPPNGISLVFLLLLFLKGFMARKGMNCIQFVNDITKHSSNQYQGVEVFQLVRVFFRMELQIGFCGFV